MPRYRSPNVNLQHRQVNIIKSIAQTFPLSFRTRHSNRPHRALRLPGSTYTERQNTSTMAATITTRPSRIVDRVRKHRSDPPKSCIRCHSVRVDCNLCATIWCAVLTSWIIIKLRRYLGGRLSFEFLIGYRHRVTARYCKCIERVGTIYL